jgi:hypothetical protein
LSDRQLRKELLVAGVVHQQRYDPIIHDDRHFHLLALSLAALAGYDLKVKMPNDLFG